MLWHHADGKQRITVTQGCGGTEVVNGPAETLVQEIWIVRFELIFA